MMQVKSTKVLIYAGIVSIMAELFSIYYSVPSSSNPKLVTYPILNYMGSSEGLMGGAIVSSGILISLGLMFLNNKTAFSISYLAGLGMALTGIALVIYGFENTIPVSTQIGIIYIEPLTTQGGLTAVAGIVLIWFTALFKHLYKVKQRGKNVGQEDINKNE